ncbi:MAG: hypothetical protein KGR19_09685, partial [Acidobacteria bacterium]|nr:hypothetical protein [Acidobacteriota bacterium]
MSRISLPLGSLRRLAVPAVAVGALGLVALWPKLAPAGPEPPDPEPRPVVAQAPPGPAVEAAQPPAGEPSPGSARRAKRRAAG